MLNYRRPLNTRPLAESFVKHVLGITEDYAAIARKIEVAELILKELEAHPTLTDEAHRSFGYRTSGEREELRQTILRELIEKVRLDNDEDIGLGIGGARPQNIKREKTAYIVSGAPASGKSSIAAYLAAENGAYILDSDYAKRKFPEYKDYDGGASLVHRESDAVVFAESDSLFEYCVYTECNIVLPLVGKTEKSMTCILKKLNSIGYKIHFINIVLDRRECALRAYYRYDKTKRYVPLSYVFDEVGNEPERIYFVLKRKECSRGMIASFSQIDTGVSKEEPYKLLEASEDSPVVGWEHLIK